MRRHRRVDVLTDRHARFLKLKARFPDPHRRYAGILLDVLFDHFLSVEWSRVAPGDRDEFIEGVYRVLCDHPALLPPPQPKSIWASPGR